MNQPDRASGGASERTDAYDIERLEQSTRVLVELCEQLQDENARLKKSVSERDAQVAELEARIAGQNQRRAEAQRRIDDLVGRLEWIDAQLAKSQERSRGSSAGGAGGAGSKRKPRSTSATPPA